MQYIYKNLLYFTFIFHIVAINHYKVIKSMDNNIYNKITDAKSKQSYKLSTVILLKINEYGVTVTIMMTKSKKD